MGTKNELVVTMLGDTEIVMTRVFDAPRRAVFEAHSSGVSTPSALVGSG